MLVFRVHFTNTNTADKLNDEMRVITGWGQVLYRVFQEE
jgi:hypothetical protein